jgi:predicted AAA+ superfamily ATPase
MRSNRFGVLDYPAEVEDGLRRMNPWWEGRPLRPLPDFRRWAFEVCLQRMKAGLAPAILLRGPRQVGKTTIQEQLIEHLLTAEHMDPRRILRVQFDDLPTLGGVREPVVALARWFESRILGKSFNEAAREEKPAFLFFDEVQNLEKWSVQLKSLVDVSSVRVLVTGSSALRMELGEDSLAGRVSGLDLGPLHLREVAELRQGVRLPGALPLNGHGALGEFDFWVGLRDLEPDWREIRDRAFRDFSHRGGYPRAQERADRSWEEIADHLNEAVIERALKHDLRVGSRGRKRDGALLEEVFRLACRYAGQAPGQALYVREIHEALDANVGWGRIRAYLEFLEATLLLRLIRPLEIRLKRKKGNYKLALCDTALRAAWLGEVVPLDPAGLEAAPHLSDIAGDLAESVLAYFLAGIPNLARLYWVREV